MPKKIIIQTKKYTGPERRKRSINYRLHSVRLQEYKKKKGTGIGAKSHYATKAGKRHQSLSWPAKRDSDYNSIKKLLKAEGITTTKLEVKDRETERWIAVPSSKGIAITPQKAGAVIRKINRKLALAKPVRGEKFTKTELGKLTTYTLPQGRSGSVYWKDSKGRLFQAFGNLYEYVDFVKN